MTLKLRYFWIKLADRPFEFGYGITAWNEQDALALFQSDVLFGEPVPPHTMSSDISLAQIDQGHVVPNMVAPTWRGVWFPRGFDYSRDGTRR